MVITMGSPMNEYVRDCAGSIGPTDFWAADGGKNNLTLFIL